ncbi:hypothetical protein Z043_106195, partial [Scleropages formosus]
MTETVACRESFEIQTHDLPSRDFCTRSLSLGLEHLVEGAGALGRALLTTACLFAALSRRQSRLLLVLRPQSTHPPAEVRGIDASGVFWCCRESLCEPWRKKTKPTMSSKSQWTLGHPSISLSLCPTARTRKVLAEFGTLYQQQYGLALFNKVPLEGRSIFSGAVYQYLEENKKWRIRFLFIPDSYNIEGQQPKGVISCAGYKVLTSMDEYLELLNNSLPGVKAKAGGPPFPNSATQFPLLLWHPYTRHYCFCVLTEKEHNKWMAVFQDCIRHANNGLPEDNKVQTPAFTDSVRLYRQHHEQYGTWDMMCGRPPQILANLVMETLVPELRNLIGPRLKGKLYQRQRNWMLILDAVYHQVLCQTQAQYEALVQVSYSGQPQLESSIRTDMDQIITSKEHVASKIRALVQPKAEQLLKDSVEPDITFILEALMEPTSRGFAEVRDLFFRELTDMSNNIQNDGSREKLGEHMEKVSMLAYHPVKMQNCYDKVEQMNLEGLQRKFDVSSPSQMDNTVYTFEHLLHQSLSDQEGDEVPKIIQRCLDRVMKKYDYDSSTVRKKFFKEALLQIIIPYMLKQLNPSCAQ